MERLNLGRLPLNKDELAVLIYAYNAWRLMPTCHEDRMVLRTMRNKELLDNLERRGLMYSEHYVRGCYFTNESEVDRFILFILKITEKIEQCLR